VIEFVTMIPIILFVDEGRGAPPREGRSWLSIGLGAWGTDILRQRSYVWLLVSRLFYLMSPTVLVFSGFFYLTQSLGYSVGETGTALLIITGIVGVTTGLTTLPAARLSDRIGRKRTIYGSIALGMIGMLGVALAPAFEVTVLFLVPVGISAGAFLAVDWALMTDIIPKATTGRYMGISNVATAISGPLGRLAAGPTLTIVLLLGLPADADPVREADRSATYALAPRVAMALPVIFLTISALTLTRVDERRRED
ncbi:MAG TPA: MFS transporter, partial [Candidatus Limnocylindria bacterium]|nr:MFS transporter [Candidatus Limnocylindria bacterium]